MNYQLQLLQKFPSFDPEWSQEVKDKWFEIFEELKQLFPKEAICQEKEIQRS